VAGAALVLLLVAAGHGFAGDLYLSARELAALRQERDLLAADVERLRTELALESATRDELERRAAELNARVAELDGQVEFLQARRPPARNAE
jgi:chromosome segregation ATPase